MIILCIAVSAFTQQDMKNMPGMDTAKKVNKQPAEPVFYTAYKRAVTNALQAIGGKSGDLDHPFPF